MGDHASQQPQGVSSRRFGSLVLLCWGPFLAPPLYLALIFWLQPPDHLGSTPDKAPWLYRTVYDDWDLTAMALRGLNASLGRSAGRDDNPDQIADDDYSKLLEEPSSLQARYLLEYPHGALLFFRLPYWIMSFPEVPAALCDGGHGNIVDHRPRNERERLIWQDFRRVTQIYMVFLCVGVLLQMAVVRAGYEPGAGGSSLFVLLILPGALYFSLNRFDLVPALLTALGLACLGRRHFLVSGLLFGAATTVKIYPVVFAPLVLHFLWPCRRDACSWLLGYVGAGLACFLPALLLSDWQSVWEPIHQQLTRLPYGMTAYGYVLPRALETNDLLGRGFRLGTVGLVLALLAWRRPPDLTSVVRRGAIVVLVLISLAVFYSPQWIVWLLPLLVPLARQQRSLIAWIVALDLVTFLAFPLGSLALPEAVVIYARYAILTALVGLLAWGEWRRPVPALMGRAI